VRLSDAISAHRQQTKVELDACRTPEKKITVLTNAVQALTELESDVKAQYEAGILPGSDIPEIQYRQETEISLAKLQSTPKN
jgi:hypothetical protein